MSVCQRLLVAPLMAGALLLSGCFSTQTYELPLMPAPEYVDGDTFNPFSNSAVLPPDGRPEVLYATLRLPAEATDNDRYYSSKRAQIVRLGEAHIDASRNTDWEQLRDIGLVRSNGSKFTLRLGEVTEFGALAGTRLDVDGDGSARAADAAATARFTAAVNAQLAARQVKDIFVYVHGYRVNFENPLLVAAELWHFTGYEGVFIPFAWPAREGRLAYFGDVESARYSARAFRQFLTYLAQETDSRRIHVIGYSAGTRMVLATMHELALQGSLQPAGDVRSRVRLGNVILVGSDIDLGIVGNYLKDGMAEVAERFTFYESPQDAALRMARFVTGPPPRRPAARAGRRARGGGLRRGIPVADDRRRAVGPAVRFRQWPQLLQGQSARQQRPAGDAALRPVARRARPGAQGGGRGLGVPAGLH